MISNGCVPAFQQRVIEEKIELDSKLHALHEFIAANTVFLGLPLDEKRRLIKQQVFMEAYSEVLKERIAAFSSPF